MASRESQVTTDHDTIRRWVEEREGKPATVAATGADDEAGILRIDFPGGSGEADLKPISWDEFFRKFEEKNLAFLYQEELKSGETSRFFKLVQRSDTRH